jgi:hypothetical protein
LLNVTEEEFMDYLVEDGVMETRINLRELKRGVAAEPGPRVEPVAEPVVIPEGNGRRIIRRIK